MGQGAGQKLAAQELVIQLNSCEVINQDHSKSVLSYKDVGNICRNKEWLGLNEADVAMPLPKATQARETVTLILSGHQNLPSFRIHRSCLHIIKEGAVWLEGFKFPVLGLFLAEMKASFLLQPWCFVFMRYRGRMKASFLLAWSKSWGYGKLHQAIPCEINFWVPRLLPKIHAFIRKAPKLLEGN